MQTADQVLHQLRENDQRIRHLQSLRSQLLDVLRRTVLEEADMKDGTEIYVQGRAYRFSEDDSKVIDDGDEVRISVFATPVHGSRKPSLVAYVNRQQFALLPLPEAWRQRGPSNA